MVQVFHGSNLQMVIIIKRILTYLCTKVVEHNKIQTEKEDDREEE